MQSIYKLPCAICSILMRWISQVVWISLRHPGEQTKLGSHLYFARYQFNNVLDGMCISRFLISNYDRKFFFQSAYNFNIDHGG